MYCLFIYSKEIDYFSINPIRAQTSHRLSFVQQCYMRGFSQYQKLIEVQLIHLFCFVPFYVREV